MIVIFHCVRFNCVVRRKRQRELGKQKREELFFFWCIFLGQNNWKYVQEFPYLEQDIDEAHRYYEPRHYANESYDWLHDITSVLNRKEIKKGSERLSSNKGTFQQCWSARILQGSMLKSLDMNLLHFSFIACENFFISVLHESGSLSSNLNSLLFAFCSGQHCCFSQNDTRDSSMEVSKPFCSEQ